MNSKNQTHFIYSAAVMLFIMAASQSLSALQMPLLLNGCDTLVGLSLRSLFYLIAGLELALSAYLLVGKSVDLKLTLTAWLIFNLLIYQIGLYWNRLPDYLVCLGNSNASFPIPPRILNGIMLLVSIYCLLGSGLFLAWNWRRRRQAVKNTLLVDLKKETAKTQTA